MRDELLYNTRRLFAELRQGFEERMGARGWWLEIDDEDLERMGMSNQAYKGAVETLKRKGLLDAMGMDGIQLSDLGAEACLHPEILDDLLGPPTTRVSNVIHVSAQNAVVGDRNVVAINTTMLIQNLTDHINRDTTLPEPVKNRWVESLKDIGSHLATEAIKVVIDQALKS